MIKPPDPRTSTPGAIILVEFRISTVLGAAKQWCSPRPVLDVTQDSTSTPFSFNRRLAFRTPSLPSPSITTMLLFSQSIPIFASGYRRHISLITGSSTVDSFRHFTSGVLSRPTGNTKKPFLAYSKAKSNIVFSFFIFHTSEYFTIPPRDKPEKALPRRSKLLKSLCIPQIPTLPYKITSFGNELTHKGITSVIRFSRIHRGPPLNLLRKAEQRFGLK